MIRKEDYSLNKVIDFKKKVLCKYMPYDFGNFKIWGYSQIFVPGIIC